MPERKRKVDVLAGPESFLDKLRARRQAIEAGRPDLAREAFTEPQKRDWADLPVDGATNNRKETHREQK